MHKQNKLCISTLVWGKYTEYIPFYIFSALKSYPDYFLKIFVIDNLSNKVKKSLEIISNKISPKFEIIENYLHNIPKQFKKDPQLLKSYRWLIPKKEFQGYDNVYIGDIDFLIIKEEPPLQDFHLKHCNSLNLPYSNVIRPNQKRRRLTGLHFFRIREYYEKMENILNYYNANPGLIQKYLYQIEKKSGKYSNEDFLYMLIEKGIGFENIEKYPYRPHHGFHFGCLRNGKINTGYLEFGKYIPYHLLPDPNSFKKCLRVYFLDSVFREILNLLPIPEIVNIQKNFDVFFSNRLVYIKKIISLFKLIWKNRSIKELILIIRQMINHLIFPQIRGLVLPVC